MVHAVVMKHIVYDEKNQDSHSLLIPSTEIWNFLFITMLDLPSGYLRKRNLLYPQSLLSSWWGSCRFFVVENFSQLSMSLYFWLNYSAENDNRRLHGSIWDRHKSLFLEGCPENVHRGSLLLHICSSVVTLVKVSELAWWMHAKFEVSLCP